MATHDDFLAELDRLIEEGHLLNHPFYQAWNAGTLPVEALRAYACQYYRQVEAFPAYVAGAYIQCAGDVEARRQLLENLVEEDRGDDNHPELWLRFADGLDVPREDVHGAEALPETTAAVETFRALTIGGNAASALAALYAYEAMVPEVSETKIAGLKEHYGIDSARTLSFFTVHEQADREHRQWDRELLERVIMTAEDRDHALEATQKALMAMWTLLDGVHNRWVDPQN